MFHTKKDDKNISKEDDNTIDVNEISDMFEKLDTMGVNEVHPTRRRLSIIAKRHDIIQRDIPNSTEQIQDISHIPEHIKSIVNRNVHKNSK